MTTVYPGATPSDVEQAICIKIEERLQGLDGVKKITSTASESVGIVSVEVIQGEDINDMLDKNFVKDLSLKLYEWTGERWIISFSKTKGELSIKEKEQKRKIEIFESTKKTELFKKVSEIFPDAKLTDVISKNKKDL